MRVVEGGELLRAVAARDVRRGGRHGTGSGGNCLSPTRPRFERPSTDEVLAANAAGSLAVREGAKNVEPPGARKLCSGVWNASTPPPRSR
jgi:hypothetical protein